MAKETGKLSNRNGGLEPELGLFPEMQSNTQRLVLTLTQVGGPSLLTGGEAPLTALM